MLGSLCRIGLVSGVPNNKRLLDDYVAVMKGYGVVVSVGEHSLHAAGGCLPCQRVTSLA